MASFPQVFFFLKLGLVKCDEVIWHLINIFLFKKLLIHVVHAWEAPHTLSSVCSASWWWKIVFHYLVLCSNMYFFFYGRHVLSKGGRILLLINNDNDNNTTNNDNSDKKNIFKKLIYLLFFIKTFYPTCNKAQVRKLANHHSIKA